MQTQQINISDYRHSNYLIHDIFLNRWSPRAMSGEDLTKEKLMTLFEAARWAPSSYNSQPWYFIYAFKNGKGWDKLFDLLVEFNKEWCKNASVLVLIISDTLFRHNDKPSPTHSFDTGAAWQNLALQASFIDLVAHGMSGFDFGKARKIFNLPKRYQVEAMVAIGKPGDISDLSENMRKMEKPSDRREVEEFVFEGEFNG